MQQTFIDFLKTRRSVTAKKMTRGQVSREIPQADPITLIMGPACSDNWSTTEALMKR